MTRTVVRPSLNYFICISLPRFQRSYPIQYELFQDPRLCHNLLYVPGTQCNVLPTLLCSPKLDNDLRSEGSSQESVSSCHYTGFRREPWPIHLLSISRVVVPIKQLTTGLSRHCNNNHEQVCYLQKCY